MPVATDGTWRRPVCPSSYHGMFELTTAVLIYCGFVAVVFLGLWLYYDRRDHQRFERERRKTVFHCIRCDALYTAPAGTEFMKCPRCTHENVRLRF